MWEEDNSSKDESVFFSIREGGPAWSAVPAPHVAFHKETIQIQNDSSKSINIFHIALKNPRASTIEEILI